MLLNILSSSLSHIMNFIESGKNIVHYVFHGSN